MFLEPISKLAKNIYRYIIHSIAYTAIILVMICDVKVLFICLKVIKICRNTRNWDQSERLLCKLIQF